MNLDKYHYWYDCFSCGQKFKPDRPYYKCPECQRVMMIERDLDYLRRRYPNKRTFVNYFSQPRYPASVGRAGSGVFQWTDLVAPGFPKRYIHSLNEGNTPLWSLPASVAKEVGLKHLKVKKEGRAPSGSFKDRGMPFAVSDTLRLQDQRPELGIVGTICTSTGDTSASASAYCAPVRDRLKSNVVYAHLQISPGQKFQLHDVGAKAIAMEGDGFNPCLNVVLEYCKNHPELVVVNSANSMRIVGQETISLEIFADLNWKVPNAIVIPIGNGGNATAQMSAWLLLKQLGIISKLPKIILAQTKGCNTVVRWVNSNFTVYQPGPECPTVASAMNIQDPVSKLRLDYLRKHFEIYAFDVDEDQIKETRARFNQHGAGLCPQGAVAFHAALQARQAGVLDENDVVVVISTADSLKFQESGLEYHQSGAVYACQARVIPATVEALTQMLEQGEQDGTNC